MSWIMHKLFFPQDEGGIFKFEHTYICCWDLRDKPKWKGESLETIRIEQRLLLLGCTHSSQPQIHQSLFRLYDSISLMAHLMRQRVTKYRSVRKVVETSFNTISLTDLKNVKNSWNWSQWESQERGFWIATLFKIHLWPTKLLK